MSRRAAINALRQTKVFRNASLRLLADVVEKAEQSSVRVGDALHVDAPLIVVLEGEVMVDPHGEDGAPPSRRVGAGGTYWHEAPRFFRRRVSVRSTGDRQSRYLALDQAFLLQLHRGSFSLFASLDFTGWTEYEALALDERWSAPLHRIWVCERPGQGAPLEAMTHLLAASLARDFAEPVAVLTFRDRRVELTLWQNGRPVVPLAKPLADVDLRDIARVLNDWAPPFCHVFYVNASRPQTIPAPFDAVRFHRIVYVTDRVPNRVPDQLERKIVAEARNPLNPSAPFFSSFVPSLLKGKRRADLPFSEPIEEEGTIEDGEGESDAPRDAAARRLNRDLCRIHFDVEDLRAKWAGARRGRDLGRFVRTVLDDPDSERGAVSSRWARAITNRRVGLALSGGGASSYRMAALVEMLEEREVPVDLVSGSSGGALIGAYYCASGRKGLRQSIDNGPLFQWVLVATTLDTRIIRWQVDGDLGCARLEELEVRLVPLATALQDGEPPSPHAICAGTVGEGVQASGSAPILFPPTKRRNGRCVKPTRYVDGSLSRLIPARALPAYGADMVIAFNTLAGPRRRNPFDKYAAGNFLYEHTFVGRFIDFWVPFAYFFEQVSKEVAEDAHVFIEPLPQDTPFVESFGFFRARSIVDDAKSRGPLPGKADRCRVRWLEFQANLAIPGFVPRPP